MKNIAETILTQYAASPKLNALIDTFNDAVDPDKALNDFYDLIWNIDTAETHGLDIWGKIVNVGRRLKISDDFKYLGFSEALIDIPTRTDPQPLDQAPFYSGKSTTKPVELSNPIYRKLIMMKAMANITDCTIPNINRMLVYMFGESGRAYVRNDGNLMMSYVFEFPLSSAELGIVQSSDALPYPPGVTVQIIQQEQP